MDVNCGFATKEHAFTDGKMLFGAMIARDDDSGNALQVGYRSYLVPSPQQFPNAAFLGIADFEHKPSTRFQHFMCLRDQPAIDVQPFDSSK